MFTPKKLPYSSITSAPSDNRRVRVNTQEAHLFFTSVIGLDASTLSSIWVLVLDKLTVAKYLMAYLADTVFPAPDSPLTITD